MIDFSTAWVPWIDPKDDRPFASRFLDAIYEAKKRGIDKISINKRRKKMEQNEHDAGEVSDATNRDMRD